MKIRNAISAVLGLLGLGLPEVINLDDAPGGDLNLDDIFGEPSDSATTPEPTPAANNVTSAPAEPDEPFLKTTGSVYKTRDEALRGIEHKDQLIAQLREQVKQNTGADPLSKRPVDGPVNYVEHREKYFEDVANAVTRKDTAAYMAAQQKLIWDTLGPLAPTITQLSRANAERVVSNEIPEFKGFLNSPEYSSVVETAPLLADAIKSAEANPAAASQLPELYKVAYLTAQGRKVPELLRSVKVETQVQPRPTVHSTPVAPPASGTTQPQASLDTREGRRALIEQMEAKGVKDLKW